MAKARTRLAIAPQVFAIFSQQTKREENLYEGIERSGHLRQREKFGACACLDFHLDGQRSYFVGSTMFSDGVPAVRTCSQRSLAGGSVHRRAAPKPISAPTAANAGPNQNVASNRAHALSG
jgi:hypothetical protein